MNVFGIGLPEMALILVLALLVFGPKKLPEIGRSLGKAIRGFQQASKEFETEFKREAEQIERTVKRPMQAVLEPPAPKELASSSPSPIATDDAPIDATIATDQPEATPSESVEPADVIAEEPPIAHESSSPTASAESTREDPAHSQPG